MDLNNKVAIVTGGIRGIGFATVQYLLRNEVKYVAVLATRKPEDTVVVDRLRTLEQEFHKEMFGYYSCDVRNVEQLTACYEKVLKLQSYVDILVNNAGINSDRNIDAMTSAMIDINFRAMVHGTMIAVDRMDIRKGYKGGIVVNISSLLGLVNTPALSPLYNATKHAVVSFVRSMKGYNKIFGVRVVCLCPSMTETDMTTFDPSKKNDIFHFAPISKNFSELKGMHQQKAESVALAIGDMIKRGDDGDIWLIENDEPPFAVKEEDDVYKMRM